jgi:hypothetical protein
MSRASFILASMGCRLQSALRFSRSAIWAGSKLERSVKVAVGSHQDGQRQADLRPLSEGLLEFAAGHQVEELLRPADLHVRLQGHGIVGLHQRVEELVQPDGIALGVALGEVLAGQELLHREVRGQPDEIGEGQRGQPVGVVAHLGLVGVQDFERLLCVSLRFLGYLFERLLGASAVLVAGIADESGEGADEKDNLVA